VNRMGLLVLGKLRSIRRALQKLKATLSLNNAKTIKPKIAKNAKRKPKTYKAIKSHKKRRSINASIL
jgi:hypothetical protein